MNWKLRSYRPADCQVLADLFYETVHTVNAGDYTEEQLFAWTAGSVDLDAWNRSFLTHDTVVAFINDKIVGFGDMDRTGYLDRLYVHKDHQRQGVATTICDRLEGAAKAERILTHASITAKPFFLARGYRILREQTAVRGGVALGNYVMEKENCR